VTAEGTKQILRLRADHVPWQEIEREIVALDPVTSTYISINGSGTLLWHELASGATQDTLAARLVEMYGIDEPRARTDVAAFVDALARRGWLAA